MTPLGRPLSRDASHARHALCQAHSFVHSDCQTDNEAKLEQAELLKKVLDAVKELVTDANFDCSDEGIKLQAMDNSHVALVSLNLAKSGFTDYRCDRDMSLGMSLASLQKIVKCAGNNDMVTLRADESLDVLALLFEAKKHDRIGEYEMKLMDIDAEHLGIPDTVYDAEIDLSSAEFARIIRDLKELGESVKIEVSKEGVRFSADGDIGSASVTLKPSDRRARDASAEASGSEDEEGEDEENDEEEEEEAADSDAEPKDEDEDVEVEDVKPEINGSDAGSDDEDGPAKKKRKTNAVEDSEDEGEASSPSASSPKKAVQKEKKPVVKKERAAPVKKEKKPVKKASSASKTKGKGKAAAAAKGGKKKADGDEADAGVRINLQQAVALTFSIKYLSNFAKSTPLAERIADE
ncbi:hypothetical protein BMF94_2723 [Rhodotorula taiwanensis]|uniref:DNA sliding clamp PCNA n=1 Tax=Rhodotorula taiwanensis TaxID=741276 RepID=A0A2S5BBX4_9BASI|nr:hypothetical protein BMF94_2723 [Rhodotorula taiwanensis]